MHVNVGGLHSSRLHEIVLWAQTHGIDLIVLTETRWSFAQDWTLPDWYLSHSGTPSDRADGILMLVNKRVCSESQLGFVEVLPGRIYHLRIHFDKRSFDLLGCYQHADNHTAQRRGLRQRFWDCLTNYTMTLPNRNSILFAGDFNCSVQPDGHHVGTNRFTLNGFSMTGPLHPDVDAFHAFLHRFNLTAVNCWNAKDPPSFVNGPFGSKIDHFLMRHADCDFFSKKVIYYPQADFLPVSGAYHIPMVCTVRKIPYIFTKAAGMQSCSFNQRLSCRRAWKMHDSQWNEFHNASEVLFHQFSRQTHPKDDFVDALHQHLMPCFQSHFPKSRDCSTATGLDSNILLNKWDHRRCLLRPKLCTPPNILQAWYHWTKFHQLKRLQIAHARNLKKQQLQDLLADAQSAADRHDSFGLYQLIAKYSPKQPRKRIRLRNEQGQPASAQEARDLTCTYVRELWKGPTQIAYDRSVPTGVPFSLSDLIAELEKTPAVKAVARPYLPGLFWKCFAAEVGRLLYSQLEGWWNNAPIFIPQQWKRAWLTFLPKPNRQPTSLANLRPIALQEPLGKAVLGLVTKKFLREITPFLIGSPQYAFIPGRSALDALRRVSLHCIRVRALVGNQRRSVHQRRDGCPCYRVCGGLQLFLDVSKAFDMISRSKLFQFLRSLPIC